MDQNEGARDTLYNVEARNLKRVRADARVCPSTRPVKYSKIHARVFTGTAEPVCRNVAGVYYILDASLPAPACCAAAGISRRGEGLRGANGKMANRTEGRDTGRSNQEGTRFQKQSQPFPTVLVRFCDTISVSL